jgi:ankyrin repeat protein
VPLEKTIAPRHAFLASRGLPSGAALLKDRHSGLHRILLRPKTDAEFAAAVCPRCADEQEEVLSDYRAFSRSFRKGGIDAARSGDVRVLRALLSHGWSAQTSRDGRGASALHYAAGHGHVECCALLNDVAGLSASDRAADGATPLHWAVAGMTSRGFGTGGHLGTCAWLLERGGADVTAVTHDGNSVLHWAAWAGDLRVLRWTVEQTSSQQVSSQQVSSQQCSQRTSSQQVSSRQVSSEQMSSQQTSSQQTSSPQRSSGRRALSDHGVDVEAADGHAADGSIASDSAVSNDAAPSPQTSVHAVNYNDAAPNRQESVHSLNYKGCSAAHWAASGGNLDVCRYLANEHQVTAQLDSNPDPNPNTSCR